jgi:major membrane immunogen (membrane-anchored lipoprotein)
MKKIFIFTVLAISLVLAACGSSGSGFPTGKFIKAGTTEYGLAFNKDGTFSVFEGDVTYVKGTYKAEGNVFTETSNDGGCKTNISFNYTFDGKNLTFKYVGDPAEDADCTGRNADFNNVTYTLTK